jgi:hypothetical protein
MAGLLTRTKHSEDVYSQRECLQIFESILVKSEDAQNDEEIAPNEKSLSIALNALTGLHSKGEDPVSVVTGCISLISESKKGIKTRIFQLILVL